MPLLAPRSRRPSLSPGRFAGLFAGLVVLALGGSARADEGQWTPGQISELDRDKLAAMGLELPLEQLWNGEGGLMRAAVNVSGCSAGFISAEGLIATNHHCAYAAIQAASSVERDYLKDGFLARGRAEELPAKGVTVRVLDKIEDVTAEVLADADAAADDRERARAIDRARKRLVEACEAEAKGRRCEVAAFYSMSQFQRFTYRELKDVRLVYAPPSSIGEFGGEVDNWMWPRHTGDFTLLRAYVGPGGEPADRADANVPYAPDVWFKVAQEGVTAGDFVAVLGYPGNTERYLPVAEVERHVEQVFPARVDLYGEWIAIYEELGASDPARRIKVAASKKTLANRHKNAQGMMWGIRAMGLLDRRRAEEAALQEWAGRPENSAHAEVLPQIRALSQERRDSFAQDFLLEQLPNGPGLLGLAIDLVRRARERPRPDLERPANYMDRNAQKLWERQERRLRDFDLEVDAQLLASVMARAAALPEGQRLEAFAGMPPGTGSGRAAHLERARKLLAGSKLSDAAQVRQLFDAADARALEQSRDPVIALARALAPALEALEARQEARTGRASRLGPQYFALLRTVRPGPLYPDANGTLRLSYATITGYTPREGLQATPQTTLSGQLAKVTGEAPFQLPERVVAAAPGARDTYWADPHLGDLPLNFLSSADTTGGNSGSPVINGRGELVGLNFDRVWENIAGDFGYSERSRNVVLDFRYVLWLLDRVEDADALLTELGVGALRGAGPRSLVRPADGEPAADAPPPPKGECPRSGRPMNACGCASAGEAAPWWALAGLLLVRRRRRC